jgi:ribonuclease E
LGKATEQPRRDDHKTRWPFAWAAVAFALVAAAMPARSECLSPSEAAGATTTTVYRCSEEDPSARKSPIIVEPDKSTVVERGSTTVPWFEPKPTQTSDPIGTAVTASPEKQAAPPEQPEKILAVPPKTEAGPEQAEKKLAVPEKKEAQPEPKEEVVNIEPVPDMAAEEPKAEATPEEPKATKAEPKKKAAQTKTTKPKRKVVKKRSKTKLAKTTPSKPKVAQTKRTKPKAVKPEPTAQQIKTEPAKSDNKVILMTKKDMTLGKRIKNWLGF